MKSLALAAALLAATAITPAHARLQITLQSGANTFSCFDGQLSCDQSGGANNLLIVDQTVGGILVQLALTQSVSGAINELQLSSSNIVNEGGVPATIKLFASDTGFVGPVSAINNSASLTFNQNIGAPLSTLQFFADVTNAQGANPANTPGVLLESVSGSAATDPDSFSGSLISPFNALGPYTHDRERLALPSRAGQHHRLQPVDAVDRAHPRAVDLGPPDHRLRLHGLGREHA